MQDKQTYKYSLGEEIANGIIHGVATLLSIAGLAVLIVLAGYYGSVWHIVGFSIFGSTLIILYLSSTLYHCFTWPSVKKIFKIIDHCAIVLLIAGTYTPFLLVSLRGAWGWSLFGIIWGCAVVGIILEFIFISRVRGFSILLYILMGWLCILAVKEILNKIPLPGLILLFTGGLSYSIGVIFYAWRKLPYNHSVWHIFVLCGSICHYFSVLYCL